MAHLEPGRRPDRPRRSSQAAQDRRRGMAVAGIGFVAVVGLLAIIVFGGGQMFNGDTDEDDDGDVAVSDATATADPAPTEAAASTPTLDPEPTSPTEDSATPDSTATQASTPVPTQAASIDSSVPRSECYLPRPENHGLALHDAEPRSLFQQCQLVAYYGFPGETRMGIAGEYEPEEMIRRLKEQTAEYEELNGFRTAVPALELIFAVAQGYETADGTYLARMSPEMVERWIGIAEEHDLMLIFDIQIGSSTVEAEIQHLLPYLEHPRVHLALDPEFVTTPGTPPGQQIGSLEASAINQAQHILQQLVEEHDLPNKVLMVHQFIPEMIINKPEIEEVPGVDLVIHQDGFGAPEDKIANYNRFVGAENAEFGGFKLFYKQDNPLLTPGQLMELTPQVDVVTYQ